MIEKTTMKLSMIVVTISCMPRPFSHPATAPRRAAEQNAARSGSMNAPGPPSEDVAM